MELMGQENDLLESIQHLLRLFVMHKVTINESHVNMSSLCNQESMLLKLHMRL